MLFKLCVHQAGGREESDTGKVDACCQQRGMRRHPRFSHIPVHSTEMPEGLKLREGITENCRAFGQRKCDPPNVPSPSLYHPGTLTPPPPVTECPGCPRCKFSKAIPSWETILQNCPLGTDRNLRTQSIRSDNDHNDTISFIHPYGNYPPSELVSTIQCHSHRHTHILYIS